MWDKSLEDFLDSLTGWKLAIAWILCVLVFSASVWGFYEVWAL